MSKVKNIPEQCTRKDRQRFRGAKRFQDSEKKKNDRIHFCKNAGWCYPYSVRDQKEIRETYTVTIPARWVPIKHLEHILVEYTNQKGKTCYTDSYRWVHTGDKYVPQHTRQASRLIETIDTKPYLKYTGKSGQKKFYKRVSAKKVRNDANVITKGSGFKRSFDLSWQLW